MRCGDKWAGPTVAILAVGLTAWSSAVNAQDAEVAGHLVTLSADSALLRLDLTDGSHATIRFVNGTVFIDDEVVATYEAGSPLVRGWEQLLNQAGRLSSDEILVALREWDAGEYDRESATAVRRITDRVGNLRVATSSQLVARAEAEAAEDAAVIAEAVANSVSVRAVRTRERAGQLSQQLEEFRDLGIQAENAQIHMGDLTIPRGTEIAKDLIVLGGDVSVFGSVQGTLVALDGDVILHRSGHVTGDVVTVNGRLTKAGGRIDGRVRSSGLETRRPRGEAPRVVVERLSPAAQGTTLASILGMFIALASIGFGFTFFAPRQLEVVSETVTESFGKSFFAGLFTTPLVIPAFAMLLVGLAITIVGILLIPFAILGGIVAVIGAAVGGYLAVAKSVGSTVLTRRMAQGRATSVTPYKSLVIGLLMLMTIWLPAALLGWIPIIGQLFTLLAFIFTWVMVTAGFGAAVLSRAGLRATFVKAGRPPALTDEYYWPDAELQSLPRSTDRV